MQWQVHVLALRSMFTLNMNAHERRARAACKHFNDRDTFKATESPANYCMFDTNKIASLRLAQHWEAIAVRFTYEAHTAAMLRHLPNFSSVHLRVALTRFCHHPSALHSAHL